jgi:hypothetical protein
MTIHTLAVLLAKTEVTYNVDPTPTNVADAKLIRNLQMSFPNETVERLNLDPSLSSYKPNAGRIAAGLSFEVELKGSGTVDGPAEVNTLLGACGLAETINAATNVEIDPASTSIDSITIYAYRDGLRYIFTGCRGNVSADLSAGQHGILSFNFSGHILASPTDVAVPAPTLDATAPEILVASGFSIGGFAGIISQLSFDMGNTIDVSDDLNAADGYGEIRITGRNLTGSFDPEVGLVATNPWLDDFRTGASQVLSIAVGTAGGNLQTIGMPVVTYTELGEGERNNISIYSIGFHASRTSGDDEIQMVHT